MNKKDEDVKEVVIYTSFFETKFNLFEQAYNPETNKSYFIQFNKITNEVMGYVDDFERDGIKYKPIEGEELDKRVVILPSKVREYDPSLALPEILMDGFYKDKVADDTQLDLRIKQHIHKWLDVPEEYEQFVVYNIKLSWVYQRFNTLSYTRALGDTGTGKSRFLFTLGHLHYKPMIVSGALTSAVIFRIINKWKGTLLIDEGDQEESEETNSFIKIMNCGYEKGMAIARCDKNDPNKIDFFDVFCPKVITTRRRFEDKATEARCMTAIMVQTFRKDIPDILTQEYFRETEELREMLLLWRFRNFNRIDPDIGLKVNLDNYEPRLRQVNRAFISLFVNDQLQMGKFRKYLDNYQEQIIDERSNSFDGLIITNLAEMISNGWDYITPSDIQEKVKETGIETKYQITAVGIGKTLKNLGLLFKRQFVDGKTKNNLVMDKYILSNVFSRYLVNQDVINKLKQRGYTLQITAITVYTETAQILQKGGLGVEKEQLTLRIDRNSRNAVMCEPIDLTPLPKDVLFHLNKFGEKGEMGVEQLKEELQIQDCFIEKMLQDGDLLSLHAGRVKANGTK